MGAPLDLRGVPMVKYYHDERKEYVTGIYWSRGYHHGMVLVFPRNRISNGIHLQSDRQQENIPMEEGW
jgi:hypothetical protein